MPAMTGLDHLAVIQEGEHDEHDKAVATYLPATVLAAAADLGKRRCWDRSNPVQRWTMGRLGALCRRIAREHLAERRTA